MGTGLLAAFALSEWVGGVNRTRVRRVARRLPETRAAPGSPRPHRPAPSRWRLQAEPRLAGLQHRGGAGQPRRVELRGWVPSRLARTVAGRAALAVPGVESVINSILVRGEDDRVVPARARGRPTRAHDRAARPAVRSISRSSPSSTLVDRSAASSARGPWPRHRASPTSSSDAAAERHGGAAHGSRSQQHRAGRADPLRADARPARRSGCPGTDHAGIATQNVVERLLAKEGQDPLRPRARGVRRAGLGVRRETGARHPRAAQGHRLLGRLVPHLLHARRRISPARCARCSCGCTRKGWSTAATTSSTGVPRCLTALSNEEAEKEEVDGKLWHLRYPLADGSGHLTDRHHPSGDDAGRHGGRGAPGGRALPRPDRPRAAAAGRGPADPRSSADEAVDPDSAPAR